MNREIICILCPMGCRMEVELDGTELKHVTGNQCKKGVKHAQKEVAFPGRVLTTTMRTDIPGVPLVPVRSSEELPKDRLMDCMEVISAQVIKDSAQIGEPVIKNILGLGADIVVCRTIPSSFGSCDG